MTVVSMLLHYIQRRCCKHPRVVQRCIHRTEHASLWIDSYCADCGEDL